ncbi:MAG TPA: 2-oxoglutarate dehydrogenase E1 component [Patescibacteria group bacterium]|nr:2-oxoglutarate dehydrogenase E1 component [Patescibacteria group bacterium]
MAGDRSLADAFRRWGYLQADLDPLGRLTPFVHADLETARGAEADRWRRIYCGSIGAEFMHLRDRAVAEWIAAWMERAPEPPDSRPILERLARAEVLEDFLHRRWVGSKRYSLEGSASLLVLLDGVMGAATGAEVALIGMSHRGRLNVMINVVGKPPADVFARFEEGDPRAFLGGGDVRYHLGATGTYHTATGRSIAVHLVSNPSHLEAVDPVMMGRARARQDRLGGEGRQRVLPICLHGDAAFAGQGIVAETLNLETLPGFSVGGTVQVIVNNLIGFTTAPRSLHSSRYASDLAHRLEVPILHVNGQDPEAVARAGRFAGEFRERFQTGVVVDLIGFRRHGHSEVDDPTTTQPILYRAIEKTPRAWRAYGEAIGASEEEMTALEERIVAELGKAREAAEGLRKVPSLRTLPAYWSPYHGGPYDRALEVGTAVDAALLGEIGDQITSVPDGFQPHPKVKKGLDQRRQMAHGQRPIDWGAAEALAFGSLLLEGVRVRLAGQDSRRGTFNQRHAVLIDVERGTEHVPLQHLRDGQAPFAVHDTPLSEASALGFEYGYSRDAPDALVLWEAQFGDFANGAQVLIDQFISAAEDKWGLCSGIVILLPHGYEGQGPEHSSARLERFLQLCAEDNIQVCQPSTAAQYFHMLRRQALRRWRKPLVVMAPKGLLRADAACSPLADLAAGRFWPVIPDPEAAQAERVLFGTGRIVHEMRAARDKRRANPEKVGKPRLAIVALEQLYPFPDQELLEALAACPPGAELVWVQEEPANMGAETFVRRRLQQLAGDRHVTTVHRSASASPATGSSDSHKLEQERLLALACVGPGRASR